MLQHFSSKKYDFQEKNRIPLAWAFQKESELLSIFKYYLDQMQQTGMIDRSRKQILGYHSGESGDTGALEIRDLQGLGYDSVILPFLALLIGCWVALFQLGIEAVTICDIKSLLLNNQRKFLSKIRTLSSVDA